MSSGNTDMKAGLTRFLRRVIVGSVPVAVILLVILYFWFFLRPDMVGDLGELGKITFDPDYSRRMYAPVLEENMPLRYEPGDTLSPVVTVGDSFSQQRPNGYQNFLSHRLGLPITNIPIDQRQASPEQALVFMLNSGFFDSHPGVKWVIVETVEREFIYRWMKVDVDSTSRHIPFLSARVDKEKAPKAQESLGRMFRQGVDWIKLSTGLDDSPVCSVKLSKECFTIPGKEDMLYFYHDDLDCLSATDGEIAEVAAKLSVVRNRFADRGINMLFMLAPDKYELYQHLAVDNPYPSRPLGSQLAVLDSLGFVVNPLPELSRRLGLGEKDLFMADDSHWSARSAAVAADMIADRMK